MAVSSQAKPYTVDDLWHLSHATGQRYELVRGELVEMALTSSEHGYIELNLAATLRSFVREHALGKVVSGEVGFVLDARETPTVRAADVAFIATQRLPGGELPKQFAQFAPDLVVEVVSPADSYSEMMRKVQDWLQAGVRLVWVVDPSAKTVAVHREGTTVRIYGEEDTLSGDDVLPGFECKVADIFS
jgi:Uma2 family endonuclease